MTVLLTEQSVNLGSIPCKYRVLSSYRGFQIGCGQMEIQFSGWRGDILTGVKWSGLKVTARPQILPQLKISWNYTSIDPYIFMVWCLIQQRKNLVCVKCLLNLVRLPFVGCIFMRT
jgi:hypothetical protein